MTRAGTVLDVRTVRLPVCPEDDLLRQIYLEQADSRGMSVAGDVLVDVQPELFSNEVEVTYRARLGTKERSK